MNKKNCIMTLMCALSVLLSSFAFGFESSASNTFHMPVNEPLSNEQCGYLAVQVNNFYETSKCALYWWNITPIVGTELRDNPVKTQMRLKISSNTVEFEPIVYGDKAYCNIFYTNIYGDTNLLYSGQIDNTDYVSDSWGSGNIYSYVVKGNYYIDSTFQQYNLPQIDLLWADEVVDYEMFVDIFNSLGRLENSNQSIYDQLFESNSNLRKIWKNQDDLEEWLAEALALIDAENKEQNAELDRIYAELQSLHKDLLESSQSDSNKTDDFTSDSDNQSSTLNDLNEQNKMHKIDVDSASSSVDANIDGNAISNYGVVLSSITGNGKVIQLMLIVLSVGLVSYVLFGKR